MRLCILDAWDADDVALVNSHWVAERTAEALRRRFVDAEVGVVAGDEIDAARVAAEMQRDCDGFVYFGHGREHGLYRHGALLLGRENVRLLRGRWLHAFACLSGDTLCYDAADAGASAYLGYRVPVIVEWDVSSLPEELCALLEALVTAATLELACGERSRRTLRARVRAASERLTEWLDLHVETYASLSLATIMGLYTLASLLHRELVLEGAAVRD